MPKWLPNEFCFNGCGCPCYIVHCAKLAHKKGKIVAETVKVRASDRLRQKREILRHFQGKLCGKKGLLCGK